MKKRVLSMCAAAASLLLVNCSVMAGELKPAHISQDATWFAHFNFEAGADSKIFEKLTSEKEAGSPSRLGEWLSSRYGIDLQELDGLTMYSHGTDDASTISLLYGNLYEQKLLDTVKQQASVSSREVGNVTYHTWKVEQPQESERSARSSQNSRRRERPQSGEQIATRANSNSDSQRSDVGIEQDTESKTETYVTAAFLDQVAVFANSSDQAEQAITTIQNQTGLDAEEDLRLQETVQGTVLVQAVVLDVGKTNPNAQSTANQAGQSQGASVAAQSWAILGDVDTVAIAIGEMPENAQAFVAVEAKAKSEQSAQRVGEILEGLQALAALSESEGDFDLGSAKPEVEQEGSFLRIGWTLDVDQVAEIIDRKLENTTKTAQKASAGNRSETITR